MDVLQNIHAVLGKLKKKPNNITELCSLRNFVEYFRRAIPNFSQIAKPLYDILKKIRFEQQIQTTHQLDKGTPIQLR